VEVSKGFFSSGVGGFDRAFKYLFLVIGRVGDIWIYPKF
jgi:hypothetical protein